jgi:hypothetical protein
MKKLLFSAAIAALALASCKKSNGDEAKAITKENIIGTFKVTAFTYTLNGVPGDGLKEMEACEKDDLHIFKAGDVYEYADAGTKCDPDGSYLSTWSLVGDQMNADGESGKITLLTATKMETTQTVTQGTVTLVSKITLTRQ